MTDPAEIAALLRPIIDVLAPDPDLNRAVRDQLAGARARADRAPGDRAPVWLTVAQAAGRAKVTERTIREWIRSGKVPTARQPNGRPLIDAESLRPRRD